MSSDRINKVSLGKFDQAVVLSQYLINNGIDNLWIRDSNSDDSVTSSFTISDPKYGSMENVSLASPRLILQPSKYGPTELNDTLVVFQMRFEKGTLKVYRDGQGSGVVTSYDMSNWKIGYKSVLMQRDLDSKSDQYGKITSKLPSGSYSIGSLFPTLSAITDLDYWSKPTLSFSSFGSYTDTMSTSVPTMRNFGALLAQKLLDLWNKNLLTGGYSVRTTDPNSIASSQHPPTFVPTSTSLQTYPFIGTPPLAQPIYGLQGDARMNSLCFLSMTDDRISPNDPSVPINGNWTNVRPPTLATSTPMLRSGWTVSADSQQPGNEAANVLDGNINTFWHTTFGASTAPIPHNITIDMKQSNLINGITYLPRQDGGLNGTIGKYNVQVSNDSSNFTTVANGYFNNDSSLKQALFPAVLARWVRLSALSESQGTNNPWTSAADINVLSNALPKTDTIITVDSAESGYDVSKLSDANVTSFWHTQYNGGLPPFPHTVKFQGQAGVEDLVRQAPIPSMRDSIRQTYGQQAFPTGPISGLTYLPRQDGSGNGRIGAFRVEASRGSDQWFPLASGSWPDDATAKSVSFSPITAPWFRLIALSEAGGRGPWASGAEINLLDARGQVSDQSSSDYGTFMMSRDNFFGRYLLPKLRVFNFALEASVQDPIINCDTDGVKASFSWEAPDLRVGTIDNGEPRFDFSTAPMAPSNTWQFSSHFPSNPHGHKSKSGILITSQIWTDVNCNTNNHVSVEAGTPRIRVAGTTVVDLYVSIKPSSLDSSRDDRVTFSYSWAITLELASVSDGGLAINMVKSPPQLLKVIKRNDKNCNPGDLNLIKNFPGYLEACFNAAATGFGDLEKALQDDLAGQQKFYFPASGTYFFKDPVFNANGDLLCSMSFNGVEDDFPNPDADPRKNIDPGWVQQPPSPIGRLSQNTTKGS